MTSTELLSFTPSKKVKTKFPKRNFYKSYVTFGTNEEAYLIDKKYVGLAVLGKGAYGTVVSATNTENGKKVAIKKVANAFCDCSDAKRTLREIKMLMHLDHPNVCKIIDIIPPFGKDFRDVYIVMNQMDVDLHRVIYSSQKLAHNHIKYFMYQIVKAMDYIHSSGIVHRDLKPSNILVNENCAIKICDFGLARACADSVWVMDKSQYVVTRWYRAPELLCYYDGYDKAIDNWSIGCILAELYDRKALFNGKNYRKTLQKILLTVGSPSSQDLLDIKREKNVYLSETEDKKFKHNRDALRFCKQRQFWKGINFANRFNHCGKDGADLLGKLLQFNPRNRITCDKVLEHPYLAAWRIRKSEVKCDIKFDESYEHRCYSANDIKEVAYKVVMGFRKNDDDQKKKTIISKSLSELDFVSPSPKKRGKKKVLEQKNIGNTTSKSRARSCSNPTESVSPFSSDDISRGISSGDESCNVGGSDFLSSNSPALTDSTNSHHQNHDTKTKSNTTYTSRKCSIAPQKKKITKKLQDIKKNIIIRPKVVRQSQMRYFDKENIDPNCTKERVI